MTVMGEQSMNVSRVTGRILMVVLLTVCVLGVRPWRVFAQSDPGYTKVGSTVAAVLRYQDFTVQPGHSYQYEITAFNTLQESVPFKGPAGTIPTTTPPTGGHNADNTWGASPSSGVTGYNVYRTEILAPNPPAAVSTIFN